MILYYKGFTKNQWWIIPSISKERISAITAGVEITKKLIVKNGDSILIMEPLVCDPGERSIEHNLGYYRGESFTYEIDITR